MEAIISDIHGNLEALQAVVLAIEGVKVICLGDVVCCGADSIECVRISEKWDAVIAGPMDLAMTSHNSELWSPVLDDLIHNTRRQLLQSPDADSLFRILKSYRSEFALDDKYFFHGAPRDIRDWIFPEDIYDPSKLNRLVDFSPESIFIGGGSHIPGIYVRSEKSWDYVEPENGKSYDFTSNDKTIVSIGSVGQPRDGDPRAAYALLDDRKIVFQRIDYDMDAARKKIEDDPDIDDMFGARLPEGK